MLKFAFLLAVLRIGAQFIYLPETGGTTIVAHYARGGTVDGSQVAFRPLTVTSITAPFINPDNDKYVRLSGPGLDREIEVRLHVGDDTIAGLMPIVPDDADVLAARATFEDRRVWAFGGSGFACAGFAALAVHTIPRPSFDTRYSFFVERIVRVQGELRDVRGSNVVLPVTDPLIAVVRIARSSNDGSAPACGRYAMIFGEYADMQRALSPAPFTQTHPEWPPSMVDAVMESRVVPGMTHAMVAWSIGFPTKLQTLEEYLRAPVWSYGNEPQTARQIRFAGDRVVSP